jgi:helicase
LLLANVEHLVNSGEQVLVFLKARRNCEQLATALAQRNFWAPAEAAAARIKSESGSVLGGRLEQTLSSAVAFHHADLSFTQRRILEEGFRTGEIRVLVSTTTLSMGVNLPAQTVFIDCYKYQIGSRSGRPMVCLSWSEYEGMSGRAGRYGISLTPGPSPSGRGEKVFGRSVLIAGSRAEAETMWQTYVEGKPGRLESRLTGRSLYDVVLDLIASRCARRSDDVGMLLLKSHCLQGGGFNSEVIATVIDKLAELKLIFIKEGNVEASPIGALISRRGVGVASGMMMVSFCRRYQICDRQSWLYFTLSLPDANVLPVYISRDEELCACYRRRLCEYVTANPAVSEELRKMVRDDYVISCEQNVRLKAAFLLLEWIGEKETTEIELDYHLNLGSILQVAETTAWLLDTAAGDGAAESSMS